MRAPAGLPPLLEPAPELRHKTQFGEQVEANHVDDCRRLTFWPLTSIEKDDILYTRVVASSPCRKDVQATPRAKGLVRQEA